MTCRNGHGFDVSTSDDAGRCPVCGDERLARHGKAKKYWVTRADLYVLRDGLKAAMILAKAGTKIWPESVVASNLIEQAEGRLQTIKARTRYGKRKNKA